jgi:hypothetical protein
MERCQEIVHSRNLPLAMRANQQMLLEGGQGRFVQTAPGELLNYFLSDV